MNRFRLSMIPTLLSSSRRRASLAYRCISQFIADPCAKYERPTPVVLLSGEGCSSVVWSDLSGFLSKHGYGGACMEYPTSGISFEEMANLLHKEVLLNKFTPPIVVAHSLSTFVVQKYLESFALSGLVLVNPIPPNANQALPKLSLQWNNSLHHSKDVASIENQAAIYSMLFKYYEVCMETNRSTSSSNLSPSPALQNSFVHSSITAQPFSSTGRLLQSYQEDGRQDDTVVNLERGAVPTLVVTTDGDRSIISPEEMDSLLQLHAVSPEDVLHFNTPSRAPMITNTKEFNESIFNWIEAVT